MGKVGQMVMRQVFAKKKKTLMSMKMLCAAMLLGLLMQGSALSVNNAEASNLLSQDDEQLTGLRTGTSGIAIEPPISEQQKNGRWLQKQISKAKKGSVITIPQGYYNTSDLPIRKTITLRGEGDVIFQSSRSVSKGLLVPALGASLTVENITFRGATAPDQNGAGIRNDGENLTVINCIFEGNENAILSTGSDRGDIEITNSTFLNSGYGDGQSHGIYIRFGKRLIVDQSRFIGTRIGHHVKSLATFTTVQNSYFDDAGAGTSYTVDVTRGGDTVVKDNFIIQRESAENATIINYDDDRGGDAGALLIEGNRVVNLHPSGRFYRNGTRIKAERRNNTITNEGKGRMKVNG